MENFYFEEFFLIMETHGKDIIWGNFLKLDESPLKGEIYELCINPSEVINNVLNPFNLP